MGTCQFIFISQNSLLLIRCERIVHFLTEQDSCLSTEYIIKHKDASLASINVSQNEVAQLEKKEKEIFELWSDSGGDRWTLSKKVDGRIAPFSIIAIPESQSSHRTHEKEDTTLKIKNHLFRYNENFYMIGMPEGKTAVHFIKGAKYICRLVNFPFSDLDSIDPEMISRLRRLRGIPAGEIFGLGSTGFHAIIEAELERIGLPLAASCYLIYSTF
jgi:hypothetical protein